MISDELISAYLDAELSAEERLQVEQALHDNAEFRRLFEELRELRGRFDSLPRFQPRKGLADRILRRAERAMLSPAPSARRDAASGEYAAAGSVEPATVRRAFGKPKIVRRVAWVLTAAAAALLIALVTFQTRKTAVVQRPESAEPAVAMEKGDAFAPATERFGEERLVEKSERRPEAMAAPAVAEAPAVTDAAGSVVAGKQVLKAGSRPEKASVGQPLPGARDAITRPQPSAAERGRPAEAESSKALPEKPVKTLSQTEPEGLIGQLQSGGDFVVRLDVTREALGRKRFDETLAANQIVLEAPAPERRTTIDEASRGGAGGAAFGLQPGAPTHAGNVEVVLVEATLEQIANTLSDLAEQPAAFPAVLDAKTGQDARESLPGIARSAGIQLAPRGQRMEIQQFGRRRLAVPGDRSRGAAAESPPAAPDGAGQSAGKAGADLVGRFDAAAQASPAPADQKQKKAADSVEGKPAAGITQPSEAPARGQLQQAGIARRIPTPLPSAPSQQPAAQTMKRGEGPSAQLAGGRASPTQSIRLYFVLRPVETAAAAAPQAEQKPHPVQK